MRRARRAQASTGTADTVRSIVNWPITRVPSYSTAVCPGATPSKGVSGRTVSTPSSNAADAGTGSAWARICTSHANDAVAGRAPPT